MDEYRIPKVESRIAFGKIESKLGVAMQKVRSEVCRVNVGLRPGSEFRGLATNDQL